MPLFHHVLRFSKQGTYVGARLQTLNNVLKTDSVRLWFGAGYFFNLLKLSTEHVHESLEYLFFCNSYSCLLYLYPCFEMVVVLLLELQQPFAPVIC